MDVARLRNLADEILIDYKQSGIIESLQLLENAFLRSVQSPNADTAKEYETAEDEFFATTGKMATSKLPPSKVAMLEHLHASDLTGVGLTERVQHIVQTVMSPASVVTSIQDLRSRMTTFRTTLTAIRDGLSSLGVAVDPVSQDAAEAEITLPGKLYDDSLAGLARESKKLNGALLIIVEAATGSRPSIGLRAVSTGSLDIVVTIDLPSAVLLLSITVQILSIINNALGIKKNRIDLESRKAPQPLLEQLSEWYQKQIEQGLEDVTTKVLSGIANEARRNEVTGETAKAIRYLADRIDRGMRVNVETPPANPEDHNADLKTQISELQQQVISVSNEVKRLSPKEPVLALPAAADDVEVQPIDI